MGILDRFRRKKKEGTPTSENKESPPATEQEQGAPNGNIAPAEEVTEEVVEEVAEEQKGEAEEVAETENKVSAERGKIEAVRRALSAAVRDHKNWSDRLVDEKFFSSKEEAKAFASGWRKRGYYAKLVKVEKGYKVYVYSKRGAASAIFTGNWKGMRQLEKMNTNPLKVKKSKGFTMGSFDMGMGQMGMPDFGFNLGSDLTKGMDKFSSFDFNVDVTGMMESLDLGDFELGGLGGGNVGPRKKKRKKE